MVIQSEFSSLRKVLVHKGENLFSINSLMWRIYVSPKQLKQHPEYGPINKDLFVSQVNAFHSILASKGISLVYPKTQIFALSQAFTRDPCFVIGDTLFIGAMKMWIRLWEANGLKNLISSFGNVVDLRVKGAVIEGGDVMVLSSNTVLIGSGQNTNQIGFDLLKSHLTKMGFTSIFMVPHMALHLDCCISPLPNGSVMVVKHLLHEEGMKVLNRCFETILPIDRQEADFHLAANIFWLNPKELVSNINTPKTNDILRGCGYHVHELDLSNVTRFWGGVRCLTCPLDRL